MKHLKTFSLFESTQNLTPEQVQFLDKYTDGTWSVNPSTGLVDVKGNFKCYGRNLKDFNGVRFGEVTGSFVSFNNLLQSLEGAPQTVGGKFDCSGNSLTTLVGAPQTVRGTFYCSNNFLQSLEGAPRTVGGSFICRQNKNSLRTLEGAPQTVGVNFDCSNNSLTTLEGAPQTVGVNFDCSDNSLQSLKGAPQEVGGYFDCTNNSLTTLEGAPQTVGWYFDCSNNSLTTLEGAPQEVGGYFSSAKVNIPKGRWTMPNLAKEYLESSGEKKVLLGTLVSPEALQRRIDQNPEKMAVELKEILRDLLEIPGYQNIKFPERLQREADLLGDLSGVGL